jgi:hypothetical protein
VQFVLKFYFIQKTYFSDAVVTTADTTTDFKISRTAAYLLPILRRTGAGLGGFYLLGTAAGGSQIAEVDTPIFQRTFLLCRFKNG